MIAVDVLTTREELLSLRPAWKDLWSSSGASIFSDFDWLFSWWETLGRRDRPFVLRARRGSEVLGIAPLMLSGTSAPWISFFGTPMCDYCDVLVPDGSPSVLAALVETLLAAKMWHRAKFERVAEGSAGWRFCRLAVERGLPHICSRGAERFAYEATPEDLAARDSGSLAGAGKRRNASHFRKHTELARLWDPAEIRGHLPNLFAMHAQRWVHTETPSEFHSPLGRAFFYRLVDGLAPQGLLSLNVLSYVGRPVAYSLDLHDGSTCYRYTLAYSPYHAKASPASLLASRSTQQLLANGCTRIDYLRGGQNFKRSLANTAYRTDDVELFRNRLVKTAVQADLRLRESRPGMWMRSRASMRAGRKRVLNRTRKLPETVFEAATGELWEFEHVDAAAEAGRAAGEGPLGLPPAAIAMASLDSLPELGDLYGYAEGSPQLEGMAARLNEGAACYMATCGVAPVAAGWTFKAGHAQGSFCPALSTTPAAGPAEAAVLCQLTGSPAAGDVLAFDRLVRAFLQDAEARGKRGLIRAPRVLIDQVGDDLQPCLLTTSPCARNCEFGAGGAGPQPSD